MNSIIIKDIIFLLNLLSIFVNFDNVLLFLIFLCLFFILIGLNFFSVLNTLRISFFELAKNVNNETIKVLIKVDIKHIDILLTKVNLYISFPL